MTRGLAILLAVSAVGCGEETTCVIVASDCTPQYAPTYDAVYANTLATSCQLSGCHGATSSAGGLALGDTDQSAYAGLLDGGWVIPGDASCSPAFTEIHTGSMPVGAPLAPEEQCAVQQWIDGGATR